MRTWDVLDEKEKTMDVIKGYVDVNDDVVNETMKYLGEVWTERQRKKRNRVNVSCHKMTIIPESEYEVNVMSLMSVMRPCLPCASYW